MSYYITDVYRECSSGYIIIKYGGTFNEAILKAVNVASNEEHVLIRKRQGEYEAVTDLTEGSVYLLYIGQEFAFFFSGTLNCKCQKTLRFNETSKCYNNFEIADISNDSINTAYLFLKSLPVQNFKLYSLDTYFGTVTSSCQYGESIYASADIIINLVETQLMGSYYPYCASDSVLYHLLDFQIYDESGCKLIEFYSLNESSLKINITYDCKKGIQYINNPKAIHNLPPVGTKLKNGDYKWLITKRGSNSYTCKERCYEAELTVNCLTTDKPRTDPTSGCTCCLVLDKDVIITPFPDQCSVKVENKSQKTIRVELLVYPSINHTCSGKGSLRKQISLIPNKSIVWQYDVTFDSKIFIAYEECFLQKCLLPCSTLLSPVKNYVTSVEARKVKISAQEYLVIDNNDKYNGDVTIELPFLKPHSKISIPKGQSIALKVDEIPTQTQIVTTSRTWEGVKVEKTVSIPVSFDTETIKTVVTF